MQDTYSRIVDYLRVSVTDRCNYRCAYCMPPEGITQIDHSEILSFEEIIRIVAVANRYCGIKRVRLTGGEPLVRNDIVELVRELKKLGIVDLSMTTNGSLFAQQALELKQAGLDRVNISVDTLDVERYRCITGGGNLQTVFESVGSAITVGFRPVKLNVVVTTALTRKDLAGFFEWAQQKPVIVRFIEYMPIGYHGIDEGFSMAEVKEILTKLAGHKLQQASGITGAGPAENYNVPNMKGALGFITPISHKFCQQCNRIRLTADGRIKPCLLSNEEIHIRELLRSGATDEQISKRLTEAINQKPAGHTLTPGCKEESFQRRMCQIGG